MRLMTANEINQVFFNGKENYQRILGMARQRQIPCARIGKRIFFDYDTMLNFFHQKLAESVQISPKETDGIFKID